MNAKFTPGPWSIGNTDPLLFGRKQGNGTEPIGYVYGPSFPERSAVGQTALANARLAAAAPDLLKALQQIMDVDCPLTGNPSHATLVEFWEYEKSVGRGEAEDRLFALAAITKALGEQP